MDHFETRHAASLLAYLSYRLGQPQAREALVELLWPGVSSQTGRHRLNGVLSSLRRQLEPDGVPAGSVVVADRQRVMLSAETVDTDVSAFLAAAAAAPDDLESARRALDLYQGPLLAGTYDDWVVLEAERLADLHAEAVRRVVTAELSAGRAAEALVTARRGVAADPLREVSHWLLVRAAAATGDRALARRCYDDMVERLARELDSTPTVSFDTLVDGAAGGDLPAFSGAPTRVVVQPARAGTTTYLAAQGSTAVNLPELVQALGGWAGEDGTAHFAQAREAWRCAEELAAAHWSVGLHTADPNGRPGEAAMALARAGAPGQVLLTAATARLLPSDLALAERGVYRLAGANETLFEASRPGCGFAPPNLPPARRAALPVTLSRFFDRTDASAQVRAALADGRRLITLTGPGGMGKSRLAAELARELTTAFDDAVWFVPLAAIDDARHIAERALTVMGVDFDGGGDPLDRLVLELRRQRSLLVLDNLEHLAAAPVLLALLQRVPELTILATSRHTLGIEGEWEQVLGPLPDEPEAGVSPRVALFADRARAARPTFRVASHNSRAVVELCERLEGIPLALELAAARVQTSTPASLLAGLDDRLDWRAARRLGLPDRQRTLRSAIAWSYDLLPPSLQRFIGQVSVFRGPFDAAAAMAVSGESQAEAHLAQLRGYSLVTCREEAGELRWGLLETVRQWLADTADPELLAQAHRRHADWYFERVDALDRLRYESGELDRIDAARTDLDELRAAMTWAIAADPHRALAAAVGLESLWEHGGFEAEGHWWLEATLRAASAPPPRVRGRALRQLGRFGTSLAGNAELLREAVAVLREAGEVEDCLEAMLWLAVAMGIGDPVGIMALAAQAKALAGDSPSLLSEVTVLGVESLAQGACGQIGEALATLARSAERCRSLGSPLLRTFPLCHKAILHVMIGQPGEALAAIAQIDPVARQRARGFLGLRISWAEMRASMLLGDFAQAARIIWPHLETLASSVPRAACTIAADLVCLLAGAGHLEQAVQLSGWVDQRIAAEPEEFHPLELAAYYHGRSAAADACPPERVSTLSAQGASWSGERAIEAMDTMLRGVVLGHVSHCEMCL